MSTHRLHPSLVSGGLASLLLALALPSCGARVAAEGAVIAGETGGAGGAIGSGSGGGGGAPEGPSARRAAPAARSAAARAAAAARPRGHRSASARVRPDMRPA
jgi:hypothetical protein